MLLSNDQGKTFYHTQANKTGCNAASSRKKLVALFSYRQKSPGDRLDVHTGHCMAIPRDQLTGH